MARDRQRAKQRRDRNRRAGQPPVARHRDAETEASLEESDPLSHGSAYVDLAHAQEALGRPDEPTNEPDTEPEMELDDDELEAGADAAMGGSDRRERATAGVEERSGGSGNRVVAFIGASWRELQRVQWPDRRQVVQATAVVLGFVIIAGAYLGFLDWLFQKVVNAII
jgi:preprotein translocase subunit SecE